MSGPTDGVRLRLHSGLACGFSCDWSWNRVAGLRVEWEPHTPEGLSHRRWQKVWSSYQRERIRFHRLIAAELGKPVLIVDLDGSMTSVRPDGTAEELR